MPSVACEVNPAFVTRWAGIYAEKAKKESKQAARQWFFEFVPDACKGHVMAAVRKESQT